MTLIMRSLTNLFRAQPLRIHGADEAKVYRRLNLVLTYHPPGSSALGPVETHMGSDEFGRCGRRNAPGPSAP
jgi:hypothetical protein